MGYSSSLSLGHDLVVLHLANQGVDHPPDPQSSHHSAALSTGLRNVHRVHWSQQLPDLLDDRRRGRYFWYSRGGDGPDDPLLGILSS